MDRWGNWGSERLRTWAKITRSDHLGSKPSALLLQDVLCIGWMRVSLAVLDIHSWGPRHTFKEMSRGAGLRVPHSFKTWRCVRTPSPHHVSSGALHRLLSHLILIRTLQDKVDFSCTQKKKKKLQSQSFNNLPKVIQVREGLGIKVGFKSHLPWALSRPPFSTGEFQEELSSVLAEVVEEEFSRSCL